MKYIKTFALVLSLVMASCAAGTAVNETETAPAKASSVDRSVIVGAIWYLWEIRSGDMVLDINRSGLKADGIEDAYSLRFDRDDRVFGRAMPNTYHGPCTWEDGFVLRFGNMASTKMLALKEPDSIKEQEFFDYLARVDRWALTGDAQLLLRSAGKDGLQAVMVFRNQR